MSETLRAFGDLHGLAQFGLFLLGLAALQVTMSVGRRVMSTIKVLARGWPPAHLDADGDWKPEPKIEGEGA